MSPYLSLPLLSYGVVGSIMLIAWIWGTRIKNYSVVDVFWATNFGVIAGVILLQLPQHHLRLYITVSLALCWSIRLGTYLSGRVLQHLDHEEGRYQQLRSEWANGLDVKFFIFFQMQALSNVVLSIPFFVMALNPAPMLVWYEWLGAVIWALAIIGEGMADWQLKQFKKDPSNKGKVCERGWWNYSRHPNYFFQLMIWIGVLIMALGSPYGWWAIICPLSIGYLIFKVTGIPMTEEQSLRSKGAAYQRYQQTTSVFIPWAKKQI